jgi:hypothetical protein
MSNPSAVARLTAAVYAVPFNARLPSANAPTPASAPPRTKSNHGAPANPDLQNEANLPAPPDAPSSPGLPLRHPNHAAPSPTPACVRSSAPSRTTAPQRAPSIAPAQNEATCHSGSPPPQTPLHLAAIRLLLDGHRPGAVALTLGIDRHTLLRWRRRPDFNAELRRLHNQLAGAVRVPPRVTSRPIESRWSDDR